MERLWAFAGLLEFETILTFSFDYVILYDTRKELIMSTMVSARIPSDVYARGVKKLKGIDSNVTDLVRAAFDYVISTDKLPSENCMSVKPGKRSLSKEQALEFNTLFYGATQPLNLPEHFDYKKELADGLVEEYEALS